MTKKKVVLKGTKKDLEQKKKLEAPVPETYKCTSCGQVYKTQKGKFRKSPSPMYAATNKFINVCNDCIDAYEMQLTDIYKDNDKACERLCQIFGWYVNESILSQSRRVNDHQSRIGAIISNGQIIPHSGKSYEDRILEKESNAISSIEELAELKASGEVSITNASIERWGLGIFSPEDYKILDDHYKMLEKQNPNCDSNQEIFVKDLCYIKLQQLNAMRDKKPDDFNKLTEQYRKTFAQAGLKTVVETDTSGEDPLGVTLAIISQYTPEEYYKNKNLYKDFDGLGEYVQRFLFRPLKNLITGSTERDDEYCIKDDED